MTTPTNSDRLREIAERIRQASIVYIGGKPVVINEVSATPAEVEFLLSEINKLQEEKAETIEVLEGFKCEIDDDYAMDWWGEYGRPLLDKLKGES